jgi:hypothetical protein
MIFWFFVIFIIFIIVIWSEEYYKTSHIVEKDNYERYIDMLNYYSINWTDQNLTKKVNKTASYPRCKYCTYSMDCDRSDDSYPYCFHSADVPSIVGGRLRSNSI